MSEVEDVMAPPVAPPHMVRVTVPLTVKTFDALQRTAFRTETGGDDVVNRAVQAYAFLVERMEAGAELVLREADGREQVVWFLG